MVSWLRNAGRMTGGAAKALTSTAAKVSQLPVTKAAWEAGELSSAQVRIITANIKQRRVALFAEHEAVVVPTLVPLTAAETLHAMMLWQAHAEAIDEDPNPAENERELSVSETIYGRREVSGSFDAVGGAVIDQALALATTRDAETEQRNAKQRRADALVDVCRFFLDNQKAKTAGRHRPHLNVVIDVDDQTAGTFVSGAIVPKAFIETLLCDCNVHRVLANERSGILDYGRSARTAPPDLFNALALRDGHCREPGCDRPASWCDAHHVDMWEEGGHTTISNMVLRCTRHHHLWHKRRNLGWTERLDSNGALSITDQAGRVHTSTPAGPAGQRRLVA